MNLSTFDIGIFTNFGENNNAVRKSFLKRAFTNTQIVIDKEGEILQEDVQVIKYLANNKEQFFLVYASLLGLFQEMTAPEVKVYSYILEHYLSDSVIALPKGMKQVIAEKLKLKLGTVNNAISKLNDKKLIYSTQRGLYKINPRYAFKGSTKERNQMLKFVLEVECPTA